MKNNRGQVLVTFVIMIPILLTIVSMVIEFSHFNYEKHRLISLTKTIIASYVENPEKNDIINLYHENGVDSDFDIKTDDGLEISFNYKIDSFFGNIIGKKQYDILIDVIGKKENGKLTFMKGK